MIPSYALAAALVVTHVGAGYLGLRLAKASELEKAQFVQQVVDKTREDTAQAIAAIKPVYKTIHTEVEREIQTQTVYRDCVHTPDGLRLLNEALAVGGK